jgi:hypothetical protein
LIHCKNLCKCLNVRLPSTTIKNKLNLKRIYLSSDKNDFGSK